MRKAVPVFLGLGGFLLVAGLIALLWAPGVVKKTPLDVNSTTRLSGQAQKLDTATGELEDLTVKATSITKSDSKVSDDNVVAFTNSSCLVIDEGDTPSCVSGKDPRLITASTDVFATNRKTAEATNTSKYLPSDATDHQGVVNKWPFDAEKKAYPYWDDTTSKAVNAKYDGTQTLKGLETYVYKVSIDQAPIQIGEGIEGTYTDSKQIFVDPRTGSIINQVDDQQRYLANGEKVLDLKLAFTDKQVATNVEDAQDNIKSLTLITKTIPLVGIIGGLLCLIAAGLLLGLSRRRMGTTAHRGVPVAA